MKNFLGSTSSLNQHRFAGLLNEIKSPIKNRSGLLKPFSVNNIKHNLRIYFVGGAGLDTIGWNYTKRWSKAFRHTSSNKFVAIMDVSHDNPGTLPINDILFTTEFRYNYLERVPIKFDLRGVPTEWKYRFMHDNMIDKAVNEIIKDLKAFPLALTDKLVLVGYSYGSVVQSHVALKLSRMGVKVNYLVLVASPISNSSYLYGALACVTKIIRKDIPGDKLSNPSNFLDYMEGARQNSDDSGPHFDLARPGSVADEKIRKTVKSIEDEINK